MHCGRGEMNINRSQAIVRLQAGALHNVIALRIGSAKMSLKMNVVHEVVCKRRWSVLLRPPFSFSNVFDR